VSQQLQVGTLIYFTEQTKMGKSLANSAVVETPRGKDLQFRNNDMIPHLFFFKILKELASICF
jgi:hypothetical protein